MRFPDILPIFQLFFIPFSLQYLLSLFFRLLSQGNTPFLRARFLCEMARHDMPRFYFRLWRNNPLANLFAHKTAGVKRTALRRRNRAGQSAVQKIFRRLFGLGIALSNATVYGCLGSANTCFALPVSTIAPRYITAMRSEICRTTPKSCEMNK